MARVIGVRPCEATANANSFLARATVAAAVAASLSGCGAEALGTFVGNPTNGCTPDTGVHPSADPRLGARLADNPIQKATGGVLSALEVLLGDCDGVGDVPLGARRLVFDGAMSADALEIPVGDHCGVFFVVDHFEVQFTNEDPDVPDSTVISDGFDLWVSAGFAAGPGDDYTIRFGDDDWLASVAALAPPGEVVLLNSDAPPDLSAAFYDGLRLGSAIETSRP